MAEIQALLPSGSIWELRKGRNFTRFWAAIADAKSELMGGICQEWAEADPCTSQRTLERWGAIWCYPSDCVELTPEKLCEWIAFINTCGAGTEGFILGLFEFVGLDLGALDVEFTDCCTNLFGKRCGVVVTISGDDALFSDSECDCNSDLFQVFRSKCFPRVIPEIECLLPTHMPAGVNVEYQTN